MECPYCNGLESLETKCPVCGQVMQDLGPNENLLDPYAPYQGYEFFYGSLNDFLRCNHVLFCFHCGRKEIKPVDLSLDR